MAPSGFQICAPALEGEAYAARRRRKEGLLPPFFGLCYKLLAQCSLYRRPYGGEGVNIRRVRAEVVRGWARWRYRPVAKGSPRKTSAIDKFQPVSRIPATALGGAGALPIALMRSGYSSGSLPAHPGPRPICMAGGAPPSRGGWLPFYRIRNNE